MMKQPSVVRATAGAIMLLLPIGSSSMALEGKCVPDTEMVFMSMPSKADTVHAPATVDATRLAIVGGTVVAGMVAIHVYQENGWWKNNQRSFHFREDLTYGRWVDKLGHFYGSSVLTFLLSESLQWSGLPESEALLWGAGTSMLFQTYVETRDGFSAWGFDRVDFAANVAGAMFPLFQQAYPPLRNLNFKFSYHPSDLLNNPGGIGFAGQEHIIFDDYEGQTIWLSVSVNEFLTGMVEKWWPDWLALSIGYGARDVAGVNPHSVLFLGLDYDMRKIIPQESGFLRTLSRALNFIHFPAPAVRISPDAIWYGLYF
jgi:hypothetical protein